MACTTTRISPAVFVLLILQRNEVLHSLSPASSRCATLAYAIMAKGWHSPTGSRTQQVHSSLDVHIHGHGQPGFTAYFSAPPGVNLSNAQVSIRVDSRKRHILKTIIEVVGDFVDKSYNHNRKPWTSSRIVRLNPNFFIFLSFFSILLHFFRFFSFFFDLFHFSFFYHFFMFFQFFIFSCFSFFFLFFFFLFPILSFFCFSLFPLLFIFFLFFFFQSSEQTPKTARNRREKRTIFFCEHRFLGFRGQRVRGGSWEGTFEGDFALMFFSLHFSFFHFCFFSEKKFLPFLFS